MKILRRYLAKEIFASTFFVFAVLVTLFAFFDLIHELGELGRGTYTVGKILAFVSLGVPGHVYELFPIAALIGTLVALAQMVAHYEFTVMRVSGLSLQRISLIVLQTGLVFVALSFIFGEFIAPPAERLAQKLRLQATKAVIAQEFRSGLWVKDAMSFVNVREVLPDTKLADIKIYEFDSSWRLRTITYAKTGEYQSENRWQLTDVTQTKFESEGVAVVRLAKAHWFSVLHPDILNVLLVVPEQMSSWALYFYMQHLKDNKQKTTRYEIALWSKLAYPLATLVMMMLALPFSSLHARMGGLSSKIFAGIMIGLAFHLGNRLFAYLGLLNNWAPAFSAIFPTLVFLSVAILLMWWLEKR